MKIRTVDDLQRALDHDMVWRKRELLQPAKLLTNSASPELKSFICRAAIAIYYAHWEGFIKFSIEAYLGFIQLRRLRQSELIDEIRLYASRGILSSLRGSQAIRDTDIDAIKKLLSPDELRFEAGKIEIDTKSNLRIGQAKLLLKSIGIDLSELQLPDNDFDRSIVDRRNAISHGEYVNIAEDEVKTIRNDMLADLMNIKDAILYLALNKKYLKSLDSDVQT